MVDSWLIPYFIIGILLLLDAIVCFTNRWFAFPFAALLSLGAIIFAILTWNALGINYAGVMLALGSAALVLDALATSSRMKIPEESNPLNLPVFG
jgi:hypothetical protein